MEEKTTSESIVSGRTYGAFRCLNCFVRISAPRGAKSHKCPNCGFEWRIYWVHPDMPRIRGPVWDVNKKLADDAED
ncbi:MAG: hypothetical protein HY667_05895 [Chloroflexi bacterium]|nr:hypothetical protein [Chloroflexota bacterium]